MTLNSRLIVLVPGLELLLPVVGLKKKGYCHWDFLGMVRRCSLMLGDNIDSALQVPYHSLPTAMSWLCVCGQHQCQC